MTSWLKEDDTEIYSTRNEGKSVVAEKFIKILKNVICKYDCNIRKRVY